MDSLKDEVKFLFSGRGMPYEKVSLMVAVVIVALFTFIFSNNYIQDGRVTVIDLDNSKYSRELIDRLDASPFIKINAVLHVPADPKSLFYRDQCIAAVYFPQGLEKQRYSQSLGNIGVFYDNTNSAQTAEVKAALNAMIAAENQGIVSEAGSGGDSRVDLYERELFNPVNSTCNGQTLGFLFFFSSMFFVFATIGIVPRLRMEGKLQEALAAGEPQRVLIRLLPYGGCFLTALFVGLAILRIVGDMIFSGGVWLFFMAQLLYIPALGMMSLLFGWTAANPGVAASRMILFVPGGFMLGGIAGPIPILSETVQAASHFFLLVWEYQFVRDILMRGASFMDVAKGFGAFMMYVGAIAAVFYLCFYRSGERFLKKRETEKEMAVGEG